ncbi:ribbon-helix-helix domain-containing protein [Pseudonocardia sp. KRD291]|uniref:ribbon-helix-helix domain-containing protein n=1 Tax=Pseudonocardia sp. KRD291 TaxID=2792007 RepID=UPI001C4A74D2|nr:ribbon-helix-helix domain-containing protein [Pseudonocardia sp. KRD291]MBW0103532.1 type II toxin-antitoxin system VapB family antitoxin [Pseudonocardia sp. KRD291]
MRTTITIDDHLLDQVRRRAAEVGRTVSQVIEDGVRESLLRHDDAGRPPFRVHTFSGGGTQPGVDLNDNAALLDLMGDDR